MTLQRVAGGLVLGIFGVVGVRAQSSGRTAAPSPQAVALPLPQRIVEREGNGCAASGTDYSIVWTFDGLKGQGKFDKTEQEMDIDSFDGHTLVVRRTSYAGGQIGSGQIDGTALYTGQIIGTHITGTAKYHPTGRNASEGPWCGEIEDPRVLMPETLVAKQPATGVPPQILECELNQYCDGLWTLNGTTGKAVWPRNPAVLADLSVESFSPDKIVIRRKDTSPDGFSVVYTGRLDRNRITGTALAHVGDKSVTYNWTAIIPATSCMRTDVLRLSTQEALDVGKIAQRFSLKSDAFNCYLIAARNGDAVAQNTVADMYKRGEGTLVSLFQSQYWSEKAAATLSSDRSGSPTTGQPKSYQLPASAAAALLEDGCPKDEPPEPAGSAFDTFVEAKRMKTDASDQGAFFEAMKLFCRAAKAGSGLAAFEIGEIYYSEGIGIPGARSQFGLHYDNVLPDVNKAFYWYKRADELKNTQGMVNVAFFQRSGNQIYWRGGDYLSVNQEPVDLAKAHDKLVEAARAGDTQAMGQLSGEYLPKRLLAITKLGSICNTLRAGMQDKLPGRAIKNVYPGENHDHSYTCIVTLYPPQQDDANSSDSVRLLDGISALRNGDQMSTWRFTMYWKTEREMPEIIPASVTEEVMMSVNDLALITGLLKNAK
jgi:TPR repeat protein